METILRKVGKSIFLKKKTKILIIGTGQQAEIFLKAFLKNKIQIDTICSSKKSLQKAIYLKKKYNIHHAKNNLIQILKSKKFDFIFLLVNWDKIEPELLNVLKYSKAQIFSEKPVATSFKVFNNLVKLSKKYNKKIYVMYNRRFFETIMFIKKEINKVKKFNFTITIPEQNERIIKKYGNKMNNKLKYFISSHWLDLINYICGNLSIKKYFIGKSFSTLMLKNSKCNGTINFVFNAVDQIRLIFFLPKFSLELNPLEKLYSIKNLVKRNNYYSINKRLIIDLSRQNLKPGMDRMIQSIFIKKNFKQVLPKISDLKNIYEIMEKLDH